MNRKVVLYAEDDSSDEEIFKMSVDRAGFPVDLRIVRDGVGVVEWISGAGAYADRSLFPMPDLVITDLNMPIKTGFEVLRFVREHKELGELPVIVYSSSGHYNDVRTAKLLGATAYHIKSESLVELLKTVNEILKLDWTVPQSDKQP